MRFIKKHLEWIAFSAGLLLLALMNPENTGISWCFFEAVGIDFCPGEGLGHSIAHTFRGEFSLALSTHFAGPAAVLILITRILQIWKRLLFQPKNTQE